MTINEFVKQMREIFPMCEYKATKDGQTFKSKGWKQQYEDKGTAHIPHVAKKMETKNEKQRKTKI